jgi:hypothetical protein
MATTLRIKGKRVWLLCALAMIAVVFSYCYIKITNVTIPNTAAVGEVVPITLTIENSCNSGGTANVVLCVLMPKGWKGAENLTGTYTSSKGNGNMVPVSTSTAAPNSNGLNWPDYAKKTFGLAGNLIDDMEWVTIQTDKAITYANGDKINGTINLKLKVGADNNAALVKLAYVVANTTNGFTSDGFQESPYGATAEYYNEYVGNNFSVTGGTGDLIDYVNPQLTTINPPKSLDNDIITLTYNGNIISTGLSGSTAVYLCATATTSDGKTYTVCDKTAKTTLTQTSTGIYQITLWPKSFFGISDGQTLTGMTYYITNQAGTVQVGYGNTAAAFTYKFKCG